MDKKESLEEIILKTIDIPSLPSIAAKVLKLSNDDRSSTGELEQIISTDQSFSTRILKIANSPYFGRSRNIDSISTAVMVIGFNNMKSLVIASAMKDLYKKTGAYEKSLWEHSLGVSICASVLANLTRLVPSEEAMIAGLIHDVGCNVIYNSMPEKYSAVMEKAYREGRPLIEVEQEDLGFNHCSAGGLIAGKWRLPVNMEIAMSHHHKETFAAMPAAENDMNRNLCRLVMTADAICFDMGLGMKSPATPLNIDLGEIGLPADKLDEIKEEVRINYSENTEDMAI